MRALLVPLVALLAACRIVPLADRSRSRVPREPV
jgi:hypothetical protein